MNDFRLIFLLVASLMFSAESVAQSDEEDSARASAAKEAEFAERMREAENKLEEAARRVAELSKERLDSMGEAWKYAFEFSDRPRLGVTIGENRENTPVEGVSVIGVSPGSAAEEAGIRSGDILTSVNGESLSAPSAKEANIRLLDFMDGVEEGDKLEIEYLRGGNVGKVELEPRVVEQHAFAWSTRPEGAPMPPSPGIHIAPEIVEKFRFRFGGWRGAFGDMELVELTEGLGRYFGTDSGLLVISAPESNLFQLQEGDVIEKIDGREPSSVNHCMRILGTYEPGEKVVLNIMRDRKRQTIEIEVPDDRASHAFPLAPRPVRPTVAPAPAPAPVPAERT